MSDITPVPVAVIEEVRTFVWKCRKEAGEHDNVELLDDSQVYSLHRLAASVYAAGWNDGHRAGGRESEPIR